LQAADGAAALGVPKGKMPDQSKTVPLFGDFLASKAVKRPKIDLAALRLLLSAR